jgi:CHASE2 domain-containing sensor protein
MHIFISYRRDDSAAAARLIHNELSHRFGADAVFMDVDDIGWGDDFAAVIDERIARADVVLVVVGPRWAELLAQRLRGDDWVRHEVQAALARRAQGHARVLPVLVGDAALPRTPLPPDLEPLRTLNGPRFDERQLKTSIAMLVEAVQGESFEQLARRLARQRLVRRWAPVLGLLVFLAGWTALAESLRLDTAVHALTLRLAHALPGAATPAWQDGVVIVAIDDAAVAAAGRPFGPDWRPLLAEAVRRIAGSGARTLALDITFAGPSNEAGDAALEAALRQASARLPVVVAVQDLLPADAGGVQQPALWHRYAPWVHPAIACLGRRSDAAHLMPLVVQRGGVLWPSLGLAAYTGGAPLGPAGQLNLLALQLPVVRADDAGAVTTAAYSAETVRSPPAECGALLPGDRVVQQWIDALALPALDRPPQRLPFEAVRRGDAAALQALHGRIALLGLASGALDRHATLAGPRHGVELIAAQVDGLLAGRAVRPLAPLAQALLMAALAAAGATLASALPARRQPWAWPLVGVLALAFVLGCIAWYRSEQQLVGWHYGVLALALGAAVARRYTRR